MYLVTGRRSEIVCAMSPLNLILVLVTVFSNSVITCSATEGESDNIQNSTNNKVLLLNPDFEDPIGWNNWWCSSCHGLWSNVSYAGKKAYHVTNRSVKITSTCPVL